MCISSSPRAPLNVCIRAGPSTLARRSYALTAQSDTEHNARCCSNIATTANARRRCILALKVGNTNVGSLVVDGLGGNNLDARDGPFSLLYASLTYDCINPRPLYTTKHALRRLLSLPTFSGILPTPNYIRRHFCDICPFYVSYAT